MAYCELASALQSLAEVLLAEPCFGIWVLLLWAPLPVCSVWVNKHLQWQRCIKKKKKKRNVAACELSCARALVSTALGGGLCSSLLQITPSFCVFIHAYSFLASSTKQLRILGCVVWFSIAIKGKPASCVLLGHPHVVLGDALVPCWVSERIRQRKMKPCLHLSRCVDSSNAVSGDPFCSAFSPGSLEFV